MNMQADATTTKVALAGLFHDIGKFLQEILEISPEYRANNADLYQPFHNGRHSHQHALYTAAFIEQYQHVLPHNLNAVTWGAGEREDSFINLAAAHHKANTALQWIIAMADRISSGLDRTDFEKGKAIPYTQYRRTRLSTLFEQLGLQDATAPVSAATLQWRYRLLPLHASSIFPQQEGDCSDETTARAEYRSLCQGFLKHLEQLANQNNVSLWMQHFDSLLHAYTTHIPAARVQMVIPDVSLYDHARSTSALAAVLYLFHRDTDSLNEKAICDGSMEKFLLISGDFYGIQDFIFSSGDDSGANRSKLLRGRSFYVSIFSELAADMVCRAIGLPPTAVVLNAAGKFTILAPNSSRVLEQISAIRQKLNTTLYTLNYGQSSFGLVCTPAHQSDFAMPRFEELWSRHKKDMDRAKACKLDFNQFGGAVSGYLESFNNTLRPSLCPLCGIRPAEIDGSSDRYLHGDASACSLCRDHIMLGTGLVRENYVLILDAASAAASQGMLKKTMLDQYQLCFKNAEELQSMPASGVIRIWNTSIDQEGSTISPYSSRFLNGYVPVYDQHDLYDERLMRPNRKEEDIEILRKGVESGWPKTFADIALSALEATREQQGRLHGVPALGVLKADVDNLGLLMACGLPKGQATISRMASLSRQIDSFFSIYLPFLLKNEPQFRQVYTVFAGGDDLFLLGPWNRMAELALLLKDKFAAFVCHNPEIHFSAGIVVEKPHVPVSRLAKKAEQALEQAKVSGRNRVTMFDETILWSELETIFAYIRTLESWREAYLSRALFYRLNELVGMAAAEKKLQGPVHFNDMHCLRWRGMLQYQLSRNLKPHLKEEEREQALVELQSLAFWLTQHGGAMKIPLWHVLYNHRAV